VKGIWKFLVIVFQLFSKFEVIFFLKEGIKTKNLGEWMLCEKNHTQLGTVAHAYIQEADWED
jgi:hypothetical protein